MSTPEAKIPPITMSKLYIGNLPTETSETALRQLFLEHNLSCTNILVKRGGYAFVDCPDQSSADKAIDKLNGFNFNGCPLVVEPSVASGKRRGSTSVLPVVPVEQIGNGWISIQKIIISNLPPNVRFEDIKELLLQHGEVVSCDKLQSRDPNTQTVQVIYENAEQAQRAVAHLNGIQVEGNPIKVELALDKRPVRRGPRGGPGAAGFGGLPGQTRPTDFPLRILVPSDMVSSLQSYLKHDYHEATLFGVIVECSYININIILSFRDICLKILAHNNLIGRIIGKGGNTIKRIMQETDTKITVSSINDISSFNLERIITVKGTIENMSKAEAQISAKLRQSYENDLQAMAPQTMMFPGLHPMAMMATAGIGYGSRGLYAGQAPYPGIYPAGAPTGAVETPETTYLYIPNNAVGAIIGTKGSHIRNIIRFSGASVKIAPLDESRPQDAQAERKVTIVGSPEAQWKVSNISLMAINKIGVIKLVFICLYMEHSNICSIKAY
ncbi:insulin-like growth factor 2 mRNA-binding protein 1 [Agrilus planipennis]|uniref:Insulin-like growth factor 2 mRNA-binding protein 1 n=1 Tax=Agrilus planipennis TaxID=224129 RepID=A0A7F5RA00_AGRPL|nr:insulin-like growth factor 2 mRNA-binding protein 1 [Agrilus planipennis]